MELKLTRHYLSMSIVWWIKNMEFFILLLRHIIVYLSHSTLMFLYEMIAKYDLKIRTLAYHLSSSSFYRHIL